jgi:Family of unknown function (DUF5686)/CarboxypepD_reg-like domain
MKLFTQTLLFLLSFTSFSATAQLSGTITNAKGEPLPFANVYIENTTRGTTANTEGGYLFDLQNGTYRLVFQYIGYKKRIETVTIQGKTVLNISLETSDIELSEFVVKSNAEDPAYPIIRKAIEMRKTYRDQVKNYTCDVYIKGVQKIIEAPKKIFGQDLGDMGGAIDTTGGKRQGIVYLSESISKLAVEDGKKKEELISAKVSGNDNGFGFNRATLFDFSFYDNSIEIQRQILSPITDNALSYYKYRLIGTIKDKQGNDVYKIEVIPKRQEDPTWAGIIYIVDNQYNIFATDLYLTGKSIQVPIMDTLWLRQNFLPVDKAWRIFSQTIEFKLGILGLKIKGDFTGVYSNYNLAPQYKSGFFTNEVFKASKQKDDKDLAKWDTLRPIPLTLEERKDYIKKDSLQTVHQSKTYLDSISKKQNKFKILNLLSGYTYSDNWNRRSFSFDSPLSTFSFNPVQGGNLALKFNYRQAFGERFQPSEKSFSLSPSLSYGFAEKKMRAAMGFNYLFNRFNYATLNISGGQTVAQFNSQNPVPLTLEQSMALLNKKHLYKIYDKTYFRLSYSQEVVNGLRANMEFEMANRNSLSINTQYSFRKKDQYYNDNLPQLKMLWLTGKAYVAAIGLSWTPEQKYSSYPTYKEIEGSKYPVFSVNYTKALPLSKDAVNFDKIRLKMVKDRWTMGIAGYSEINAEFGAFLSKKRVSFVDYEHFNGNTTIWATNLNYLNGYFQLPFYEYSTIGNYLSAHWMHHFESYFFDKIPLIRKLAFKEVVRVAYLHTAELKNYAEFGLGIDNIGWGLFRILKIDASWKYKDGAVSPKPMWMIGFKMGN